MEEFITHTGIGAPLRRFNVDTDQIIPTVYLKCAARTGFEDAPFAARRSDPEFVLNQGAYKNGSVLITDPNLGTGSSHERAVWALKDYGFHVILALRLADIFRGNSSKQGLVTGIISQEDRASLWKLLKVESSTEVTVSLEDKIWRADVISDTFQINDYVHWTLTEGLDDIALILCHGDKIAAYEAAHPFFKPRTLPTKLLPKEEVASIRD